MEHIIKKDDSKQSSNTVLLYSIFHREKSWITGIVKFKWSELEVKCYSLELHVVKHYSLWWTLGSEVLDWSQATTTLQYIWWRLFSSKQFIICLVIINIYIFAELYLYFNRNSEFLINICRKDVRD